MNITALLQLLSGKKTYFTTAAIGVLLFGQWQGWWKIDQNVYLALTAAAVAFLRAGIGKGPDDPSSPPPTGATGSPAAKLPPMTMLAFACLTLTLVTAGSLVSGCNTTPQQITYRAAGTTIVSVDTAMNLWGAYVASGKATVAQEQAVKAAYEKYQASMAVACDAGAVYASTSSTNAPAASLALSQAVANASQELTDLENLINSFGVKLQ